MSFAFSCLFGYSWLLVIYTKLWFSSFPRINVARHLPPSETSFPSCWLKFLLGNIIFLASLQHNDFAFTAQNENLAFKFTHFNCSILQPIIDQITVNWQKQLLCHFASYPTQSWLFMPCETIKDRQFKISDDSGHITTR